MIIENHKIKTQDGYGLFEHIHNDSPGFEELWLWWPSEEWKGKIALKSITIQIVDKKNRWGRWQTYNSSTLPNGKHMLGVGNITLRFANGDEEHFYTFGSELEYQPEKNACLITSKAPILHLSDKQVLIANYLMDETEVRLAKLAIKWNVSEEILVYCLRHHYSPLILYLATLRSLLTQFEKRGSLHNLEQKVKSLANQELEFYAQRQKCQVTSFPILDTLERRCD